MEISGKNKMAEFLKIGITNNARECVPNLDFVFA